MKKDQRNTTVCQFFGLLILITGCSASLTFYPLNLTWPDALTFCRNRHGSLVNSEETNNKSVFPFEDTWLGNVYTYDVLNDTALANITEKDLTSTDYRCLSISVRQVTADSLLWNYTVQYIPLPCDYTLPSICVYRIGGLPRWMVQSTNFSWWTRTRSRHCLQTWPPDDATNGSINYIGTGLVAFNISLLEIGRSYWIRNVLKIKESLNGDRVHVLECGYRDKINGSVRYEACDNKRGFICSHETTQRFSSKSGNSGLLVGVTLAAVLATGTLIGIVLFVRRKQSIAKPQTFERKRRWAGFGRQHLLAHSEVTEAADISDNSKTVSHRVSGNTRVWRKPSSRVNLSVIDPRASMYSQVIPASQRKPIENGIKQSEATYDRIKDDIRVYAVPDETVLEHYAHQPATAQLNVDRISGYLQMESYLTQNSATINNEMNLDTADAKVNLEPENFDIHYDTTSSSMANNEEFATRHTYNSCKFREDEHSYDSTIGKLPCIESRLDRDYDHTVQCQDKFTLSGNKDNYGYDSIADLEATEHI